MTEDRKAKLADLKSKKAGKGMMIVTDGEPFIASLEDKIVELRKTLGVGVELNNLDDLLEQLDTLQAFQLEVKDLKEAIKGINMPKTFNVEGLDSLLVAAKAIATKKEKDVIIPTTDLTPVTKSLGTLIEKIDSLKTPPQGQQPGDFVPMRRVMMVGKTLMYDDSFYTGGGGGGGASANQSVNQTQIAGTATSVNNGTADAGTQRVTLASDGTGKINLWDGTNTANIISSDSGNNFQVVGNARQEVSFTTTIVAAVASTDVSNYRSVAVQVTSQGGSSTITFQTSNNNSTWVNQTLMASTSTGTTASVVSTTGNGLWVGALYGRYFRLNVTGIASGTTAGLVEFSSIPYSPHTGSHNATGNKTNNNAAPGATNLGVIGNLANAAQPSWSEGNLVLGSSDLKGNIRMRLSDAAGNDRGANVNASNQLEVNAGGVAGTALNTYSVRLTTNTTTTPTSSTAYISSIAISTEVIGTTSTIAIQVKQGTPLKLVPANITTAVGLVNYNFQTPIKMTSGINIVTAGAVAATADVWINYYQ